MRKILMALFFITLAAKINQLHAYCIYNRAREEIITLFIFSSKKDSKSPLINKKTLHVLRPKIGKSC